MKKITLLALAVILVFNFSFAQKKEDSLIVQISMDTTTFKNVISLIQENVNSNTTTGKLLLQNILSPLYQNLKLVPREKIVSDKPKGIKP